MEIYNDENYKYRDAIFDGLDEVSGIYQRKFRDPVHGYSKSASLMHHPASNERE
jgi:hypothetical protein